MTTIGLIGAGNIGSTLAWLATTTGHDVVLSNSRLRTRSATWSPSSAPRRAGDVVVVTIPLGSEPLAELLAQAQRYRDM